MFSTESATVANAEEQFRRLFDAGPDAMFRMLVDSIPSSVVLIDENLHVVLANRNFLEKSRRRDAETLGRRLIEVFPTVIVEELQLEKQIQRVFASQHAFEGQRLTYRAPGVPLRTYCYSIIPMLWGARVGLVMLLMDDVTEQLRLAEEIRQVERHLASVVESVNEIVLSTNTAGRILTWNRAAERLSGYGLNELRGQALSACCAEHGSESIEEFFAVEASRSGCGAAECDLVTKGGVRIPVSWTFSPMRDDLESIVGIVAVGRDLTERRKFEQQLLRSQKLAALGVMAGGIAHEVRTPLAISSSAAEFLMEDDITPEFRKECAEKVHIGIWRASGIIENLLRFAHPSTKLDMTRIDLLSVLRDAITLVANQARIQKVGIVCQFSEQPVQVRGIASLLEHAFLNLFLNALNSMPDGGTLTISVDASSAAAQVRVSDTGCGIAGSDIDNIFDPFYTRAPVGKGTGLGLSICYSVIQQHGGSIEVESALEKGSTFTVTLWERGRKGARPAAHLSDRG
ncbi:MAG TPA: ATP-binding protein [Bryobacteraceae bacterium]|nr:ATP-binding protein [Bryobacteraceae bacterium]